MQRSEDGRKEIEECEMQIHFTTEVLESIEERQIVVNRTVVKLVRSCVGRFSKCWRNIHVDEIAYFVLFKY